MNIQETSDSGKTGKILSVTQWVLLSTVLCGVTAVTARAESGVTNVVDGVTTNVTNLIIGNNGALNYWVVTNAGVIVDSGGGLLGNVTGGNSNTVLVAGNGSIWSNATSLTIGDEGNNNQLTVSNQATVYTAGSSSLSIIGNTSTADGNQVLVTGQGTTWTNSGGFYVGNAGANNQLVVSNGAQVFNAPGLSSVGTRLGNQVGADNNTVTITGNGSTWINSGDLRVGNASVGNQFTIANSGLLVTASSTIGVSIGADNNTMTVTGAGSIWTNTGNLVVGSSVTGSRLTISDGGHVVVGNIAQIGAAAGTDSRVLVSDSGSLWQVSSSITLGQGSSTDNQLIISNGASVTATSVNMGNIASGNIPSGGRLTVTGTNSTLTLSSSMNVGDEGYANEVILSNGGRIEDSSSSIGAGAVSSSNNTATISGPGSIWTNSGASVNFRVGQNGAGNSLIITNGGTLYTTLARVGDLVTSTSNSVVVTGIGSLWQDSSTVSVGSNATTKGSGNILVERGAILETIGLNAGLDGSGTISNIGAVYQFRSATLTITPNTVGAIAISNGVVSFRDVALADVKGNWTGNLTNMSFTGNNAFRLNNSSNTTSGQDYTFTSSLGSTNYTRLEMVNGGTLWRSAQLTIGGNGSMLASNTTGRVAAAVTNAGVIKVVDSVMTWSSNVVIRGSYISDPSTNIFTADATVDPSGVVQGGAGDRFEFQKGFLVHSSHNLGFKLDDSSVVFTGGGLHTNTITGSDLGGSNIAYEAAFGYGTNFAYGELHLGSIADIICFLSGDAAPSNALYVGWLDLFNSTSHITNLIAPTSINIYYAADDTRNAYLGGATYQLLDHNGLDGGFLLPVIPEPSSLTMLASVAILFLMRRGRGATR